MTIVEQSAKLHGSPIGQMAPTGLSQQSSVVGISQLITVRSTCAPQQQALLASRQAEQRMIIRALLFSLSIFAIIDCLPFQNSARSCFSDHAIVWERSELPWPLTRSSRYLRRGCAKSGGRRVSSGGMNTTGLGPVV